MQGQLGLTHKFNDIDELRRAYMPFVNNGGVFLNTKESLKLGDSITIGLALPGATESIMVNGKVVWVLPGGTHDQQYQFGVQLASSASSSSHEVLWAMPKTQASPSPGVGIQFTGSNAAKMQSRIEELLQEVAVAS